MSATLMESIRLIAGKPRKVVVDGAGKIVNKNPDKEELKNLKKEPYKVNRKSSYTDDELLEFMISFYKENGRTPLANDFNINHRYPGCTLYQKRFESWNKALEKAGLNIRKKSGVKLYTDKELLGYLAEFYKENGIVPTENHFSNNSKYPSFGTYILRFGSWSKALKLVGLDVDSMIRKGVLETTQQKGRSFELYVLEHFIEKPIDLSGENCNSPLDGKCPKGQMYDAKSIGLRYDNWPFCLASLYRMEIKWFYLGAYDRYFKKLIHVWRIPGNLIEGDYIKIGITSRYRNNVKNMEQFEITDKFRDIDIFRDNN